MANVSERALFGGKRLQRHSEPALESCMSSSVRFQWIGETA